MSRVTGWAAAMGVCAVLIVIGAIAAATTPVLVPTLSLVVVLTGLFLTPQQTALAAGVAIAVAVVLAAWGELDSSIRIVNVTVGSALGITAAWVRTRSVRRIERLRDQEAAVLSSVTDALVMLDRQGHVVQANEALQAYAPGVRVGDVLHEHLSHRTADGSVCGGGCALSGHLDDESPMSRHGERVGPPGQERVVDYVVTRSPAGDAVVSLRDASERLRADRQREEMVQATTRAREQRRVLEQLGVSMRPSVPQVPGLELDVWTRSSDIYTPSGGDLVDASVLPDGRVLIIVVDALGHGVSSVRDAWKVLYVARSFLFVGLPLTELVQRTAESLASDAQPPHASLLAATVDPTTGTVSIAGGGHPPPLVVRASAGVGEWMDVNGRGVGTPQPGSDAVVTTTLGVGDSLVLYTDGLVEATRDVVAGLLGMRASAVALRRAPAQGWAERLVDAVLPHGNVPDDSIVLFARRANPVAAPSAGQGSARGEG